MTIKELRNRDAARLAERLNQNPTPAQLEEATKAMRAFYRFSAAYLASFYTEQNRNATQEAKEAADAKSERAYKKAAAALAKYDLYIALPG